MCLRFHENNASDARKFQTGNVILIAFSYPIHDIYSSFLAPVFQPIGDSCQRFIPGDAFPFAFSSLSDSFHRGSESIRRIQELFDMLPSQGELTLSFWVCWITPNFHNFTSFDLDPHATL
jgi:hypothetical protein